MGAIFFALAGVAFFCAAAVSLSAWVNRDSRSVAPAFVFAVIAWIFVWSGSIATLLPMS